MQIKPTTLFRRAGASLFAILLATPLFAEELPIDIEIPALCAFESTRAGAWECIFTAPNGRRRKLNLDFAVYTLKPEGIETLKRLDAQALEAVLQGEINQIDQARETAWESGTYVKRNYQFLDPEHRPNGFSACSQIEDGFTPEGVERRYDRVSVHCWAVEPDPGVIYQLLLSLAEASPENEAATVTLGLEFEDILSSIRRK